MTALTILDIDGRGIASLKINRPERRNALNAALIAELSDVGRRLDNDRDVRVVVLRGAGSCFCAGGDLEWMKAQFDASRAERLEQARALAHMFRTFNQLSKPLIGAVHGAALGGGVGLVSVCDSAVAVAGATFGLTETRLGLIPATIAPYVVARVGAGALRRVFCCGRIFDAAEAQALGLINAVVQPQALDGAIEDELAPYLATAPGAVAAAKALLNRLGPPLDDAVIEDSVRRLADTWECDEAREGVAAFLEKRPAKWTLSA